MRFPSKPMRQKCISFPQMRTVLLLATVFCLSGCGSLRALVAPMAPSLFPDTARAVVAPSFLLSGRAAHLQDSLRPRLEWLASRRPPPDLALERLAFGSGPDSLPRLVATFTDGRRINSHGLPAAEIREQESRRIRNLAPLLADAREAGLPFPFLVRAGFKSRDFLFQNAKMVPDTVEVLFPGNSR